MGFIETVVLATLPAGISTLLLFLNQKKVDAILLKYDAHYTPKHNIQDVQKMIKAYKDCDSLEKRERRLLASTLFYIAVGFITILIWILLFLFFPNYLFGDM
jgi:hypothetical protein